MQCNDQNINSSIYRNYRVTEREDVVSTCPAVTVVILSSVSDHYCLVKEKYDSETCHGPGNAIMVLNPSDGHRQRAGHILATT